MRFVPTEISDVVRVEPQIFEDERGLFYESWHAKRFAEAGIEAEFVQDNHSKSSQGTLRGLHYQLPSAQGKLVRVIQGRIFDVAVDLRRSSPSLGRWVGGWLSAENRHLLWIPVGFAHGFYVVSETAELVYKCTDFYSPEHEHVLRWNDSEIGIEWPLLADTEPTLSERDAAGLDLRQAKLFP